MIELKLYTVSKGKEIVTPCSFEPLNNRDSRRYLREDTDGSDFTMNRRPFARQDVYEIKLGAGFLIAEQNRNNLQRLFDAHKIEVLRMVNGKEVWVEYTLDANDTLDYERVDDIDRARRVTFKLVQSDPVWFTEFEDQTKEIHEL